MQDEIWNAEAAKDYDTPVRGVFAPEVLDPMGQLEEIEASPRSDLSTADRCYHDGPGLAGYAFPDLVGTGLSSPVWRTRAEAMEYARLVTS